MLKTCARASLAASILATAASAGATPLDLRLGLWETTISSGPSGMPALDLSHFSPTQRARVEAALKQRVAQGQVIHRHKGCLTKEQLAKDPFAEPPRQGETCTIRMAVQSSTHWKGKRICTGAGERQEVDLDLTAVSREQVKGTAFIDAKGPEGNMKVRGTYSSRWLSASCGNVK